MNKNNKGYMLVEIILASFIAFGIAYVILSLTIKLKNKNDDLLVETETMTDNTIITNKLMRYAINKGQEFDCSKLSVNDKSIIYDGDNIDILNKYASISYNPSTDCKVDQENARISIHIGLDVAQIPNENFDVNINYRYRIVDSEAPSCTLITDGTKVSFNAKEDDGVITNYGLAVDSSEPDYNNLDTLDITTGTFVGYVKDSVGNEGTCSLSVISAIANYTKKTTTCSYTTKNATCAYPCDANASIKDCTKKGSNWYWNGSQCCSKTPSSCKCSKGVLSGTTCYIFAESSTSESVTSCTASSGYKNCDTTSNNNKKKITCTYNGASCGTEYTKINDNYCYKINN